MAGTDGGGAVSAGSAGAASDLPLRACPVIVGPTAVGKTGLVLDLAARHRVEVISLDSRQIYHGLRIGTAQPSAAEQAACPHHLIDFVPPKERYSARRYRDDFERYFRAVATRGAVPVLVGGAGMYLAALREGFLDLPDDPGGRRLAAVRDELDPLPDETVRSLLAGEDPDSHVRIHPSDRYRSQRALEITRLAGRPMSAIAAEQVARPALGLAFPTFVLERPTAELDRRIARRTGTMIAAGWLEEVEALRARHRDDCPGLTSLGYREVTAHLRGEIDRPEMVARVVRGTRQYAKRQRTWFRRVDGLARGAPEDPRLREAIAGVLREAKTG
ncbi:MAG: tRNA (adenosine(37)-N6)-dimethylallyltransferase MiaA [Candidatus Krumholzibacteriia bacterium]